MIKTTINWQPQNCEDDLVRLVPLTESHFEDLFLVASDPLIWEQHPTRDRYKKEIFRLYFDGAVASGTAFLIIDKSSHQIIGSTRYYNYKPDDTSIAIGYTFLSRQCWGGQYNKSAKKLLLDYAFQFVDKVYFHIGSTNIRSQLATLKIGAVKVNEIALDDNGQKQLHFEYVIKKEDWIFRQIR